MIIFVVAGAVLVVGALIVIVVSLFRSRSARTDWLGELSDIRRSSLGDDDEVTGALEAIPGGDYDDDTGPENDVSTVAPGFLVDETPIDGPSSDGISDVDEPVGDVDPTVGDVGAVSEPSGADGVVPVESTEPFAAGSEVAEVDPPGQLIAAPAEATVADPPDVEADPEPAEPAVNVETVEPAVVEHSDVSEAGLPPLRVVTDQPDRTVFDGDTTFHEYDRPDGAVLRVDATSTDALRVVVGEIASGPDTCAVDLVGGTLWFRPGAGDRPSLSCSVRTPAGWVTTSDAVVLVQVEPNGWSYAMCLEGTAALDHSDHDLKVVLEAGQIGRGRGGGSGFEVAKVGVDTLEHEDVVKRHRRLDAR